MAASALDLVRIKIQRSENLAKHDVSISASNTPVYSLLSFGNELLLVLAI